MNLRRIARHLGVNHQSVANWVKSHAERLPAAPVPDQIENAELDELFTLIGDKKTGSTQSRLWIEKRAAFWVGSWFGSARRKPSNSWSMMLPKQEVPKLSGSRQRFR